MSADSATRNDGTPVKVLVIDEEQVLAELLSSELRYEGWETKAANDGLTALRQAQQWTPDVVVLAVALPDMDGFELLRRLRETTPGLPVLFLTTQDRAGEQLSGLEVGAVDYATKPFSLEELVARLRMMLRSAGVGAISQVSNVLTVGDLRLDEDSHEVWRGGEPIRLSDTEFKLLRYLMRNECRALSKRQILDRVWHYDFGGNTNVVELYISYLRRRIDQGRPPMIHTLRNVGYILKPVDQEGC